jgi:hypothetical protein
MKKMPMKFGKESKKEEKMEKKMPPWAYAKAEKSEGKKSTSKKGCK